MLDFFKSLFRPVPSSGETAKERLRLVLLSDHLSLAPDVIDSLKRDLLAVISRYVEIDQEHADVTFEHRDREIAMLASVPITGVRERPRPSGDLPFAEAEPPPSLDAAVVAVAERAASLEEAPPQPASEPEPALELAVTVPKPAAPPRAGANGARRRRRKKYAAQPKRAPQNPPLNGQASAQA